MMDDVDEEETRITDEREEEEEEEEEEEIEEEEEDEFVKRLIFVFYMPETDNITTAVQMGNTDHQKSFLASAIETLNRTNATYSGRSILIGCPKTSMLEAIASFRNCSPSVEYNAKEQISLSELKRETREKSGSSSTNSTNVVIPCCDARKGEDNTGGKTVWQGRYAAKWDSDLATEKMATRNPKTPLLPSGSEGGGGGNPFVKTFFEKKTHLWARLPCKFSLFSVLGGQVVFKRSKTTAATHDEPTEDRKYKFWLKTDSPVEGWRENEKNSKVGYHQHYTKKEAMAVLESLVVLTDFFSKRDAPPAPSPPPTLTTTTTTTTTTTKMTKKTTLTNGAKGNQKQQQKQQQPRTQRGKQKPASHLKTNDTEEQKRLATEEYDRILWIPQYPHVELKIDKESWYLRWGESVSNRNYKKYIFNNTHGSYYVTKQLTHQKDTRSTLVGGDIEGEEKWTMGPRMVRKYLKACKERNVPFGKTKFWSHHFYQGAWTYFNYDKHPLTVEELEKVDKDDHLKDGNEGEELLSPSSASSSKGLLSSCLSLCMAATGSDINNTEIASASKKTQKNQPKEESKYEKALKMHLGKSIEEGMVCSELVANAMLAMGIVKHSFDYDPSLYIWATSLSTSSGIDFRVIKKHLDKSTLKRGIEKKSTTVHSVCDFWLSLGCVHLMDGFYGDGGSVRVDEWLNVYLDPKKSSPNDVWLALELCGHFQRCPHCITWTKDLPNILRGSTFLSCSARKDYFTKRKRGNDWLDKTTHLWSYDICNGILKQ